MKTGVDRVKLDFGTGGINLYLDHSIADWHIIEPHQISTAQPFSEIFAESVSNPIGSENLKKIIASDDRVVIVTADGTRPLPGRQLIRAIIDFCSLDCEKVTVLVGTGSHRPHTVKQLVDILGRDIVQNCRVICHTATDKNTVENVAITQGGIPVSLNRDYLEADKRLVIGFIEPHLFAGFSGGAKGVCPAICGLKTIDAFHSFDIIGHSDCDYGKLENNPQQKAAREVVSFVPPDFLINVLLDSSKQITHIFSGHYIKAHRAGCAQTGRTAMVELDRRYPVVVTTNSGYPLDQNLYQTVKGICAASLIVEEGGTIFVASECSRGVPEDGNFSDIMDLRASLDSLYEMMSHPGFKVVDRWQAQKLVMALRKADVRLYSSLAKSEIEKCKMKKVENLENAIAEKIRDLGGKPRVAVMPHGPLTIPYLK